MKNFDVQDLLNTAKQRTGLTDFGEPDFMANLEIFIKAVNEGQGIADSRWEQCHDYFVRLLINRLRFAKDLNDHPEILDEALLPPVLIVPQPRTGSTKLHRMLGATNDFQDMLWWHMHMLARIPNAPNGGVAARIKTTQDFETWSLTQSPDMHKGHPLYALTTEEEQILHEMTFWSSRLAVQSSAAPWIMQHLAENGATEAYDFLLMQLKYVQWQHYPQGNKPFLLKSPTNLGHEDQLVRIFGRKIKCIATHRDPVNVVCSIAEVSNHYRKIFSDIPTKDIAALYGQIMLQGFSQYATHNMAWRDANPDIEFLDLSFSDINNNPANVLATVYDYLEMPLTPAIKDNINSWENDKQRNKFKKNQYSPEMFGLTKAEIHQAYTPYMERFSDYIEV